MYRCPWPSLVTSVREALIRMNAQGIALEATWHADNHAKVPRGKRPGSDKSGILASQQNQDAQSTPRPGATISSASKPHSKTRAPVGKPARLSSRPSPTRWPQAQDEHPPSHANNRDTTQPARSLCFRAGSPHNHSSRPSRAPSKSLGHATAWVNRGAATGKDRDDGDTGERR